MASTISAAKLAELWKSDDAICLIDVRTPVEYRAAHVGFARNVPLDRLNAQTEIAALGDRRDKPLYIVCLSGGRSHMAREQFVKAGFSNAIVVEGGVPACEETDLPIKRGRKAMSLERQVRIAAGSFVLLGVTLGWFVHPYLFGIAAFVGAGLVFAGITDTCGMGMILARMPWNQVAEPVSCPLVFPKPASAPGA